MSKENKNDRVVRSTIDQFTEHLHDLKGLEQNIQTTKELDVERWAQSFLKSCLGYSASAGYTIKAQDTKGKMRPDLVVYKSEKPVFVVEVKKLGFDLNKSDFRSGKTQLNEYLNQLGNIKWGILTNGHEWKLFDFSQAQYRGIEVCSFDLKSESDTIDLSRRAVEDKCYDILDLHEFNSSTKYWDECLKEAMAFSPETLAKAILSSDVIRYIGKFVKGEHEYKANNEVLTDKVFDLLILGLNEAIPGWNDTKVAEFNKYTKNQKRAASKIKRSKKTNQITSENQVIADSSQKSEQPNSVDEKAITQKVG